MYMSEMLVRERNRERLRQAEQFRAARQMAGLRHLRRLRERAERRLHRVRLRADELRSAITIA